MKSFALVAAFAGFAAAVPQAVTSAIAPKSSAPAGCSSSYSGTFQLYVAKASSKVKRADSTPLEITLSNGVLTDSKGRTGYIASNNQFQFDGPVQAGAIYTAGWSVCQNSSLALGGSTVFYECLSGSFYNLYDENDAAQCSPIILQALANPASGAASQIGDGQITAGQAQTVICQIGDGQVQQKTCVTTATVIAQQSDGQITAAPVTQIGDGQIQAPTGTPVGQISDGQVQATTAVHSATVTPITQGTDGQPAASTNGTVVVSSATLTSAAVSTAASASASQYTGAAAAPTMKMELVGLAAGLLALAAL
ncbi:hypothetical protein K461DRAFT_279284 [Myriangium duriaei CBS 260.36]|uniref:Cell wall mannoprotein PIR1-like C-terminal domain-containing protein n=1 Tax=Myriangium duriaei CBS 260.36 TaxID=1168546 RepID=A0A9P4IXL5_9PEZI|nr:hypothetical protein K461DRAFT_279284 [Myriangium duriaei CBS 260.36]